MINPTEHKRNYSDNIDLDLTIAELFQTTVDVVDQVDLRIIELLREHIFQGQFNND